MMQRSTVALTGLPQRLRSDYTQELLGWRPVVPFAEGMRRTFRWYRSEYGSGETEPPDTPPSLP
jgi:nucleoside-diphosphate-sugar epimerase